MKSKEVRQQEADARQLTRAKRSTFEQLEILESRPGNSAKETKRLKASLE
jgi:hypothetical protein